MCSSISSSSIWIGPTDCPTAIANNYNVYRLYGNVKGLGHVFRLPRLVEELGIGVFRVALGSSVVAGISLVQPTIGGTSSSTATTLPNANCSRLPTNFS